MHIKRRYQQSIPKKDTGIWKEMFQKDHAKMTYSGDNIQKNFSTPGSNTEQMQLFTID